MRARARYLMGLVVCLFVTGQGCPSSEVLPSPVGNDSPSPVESIPPLVVNNPQPITPPQPPLVSPPVVSQSVSDLDRISTYSLGGDYDCVTLNGYNFDADGQLTSSIGGVSNYLTVGSEFDSDVRYHSLIKFGLNGKPVRAGRVELKLLCSKSFNPSTMYLERITSSWGELAGHVTIDKASRRIISSPISGQWYGIDITDWYNNWQNNSVSNFGFVLRPAVSASSGWAQFYSNSYGASYYQPRLIVITGNLPLAKFVFPLSGKYSPERVNGYRFGDWWQNQSCLYGVYILKHTGIDIKADVGDEVRAIKGGKVVYAQPDTTWGGYIVIEHPGPYTSTYEHLSPVVSEGDAVLAGQKIGIIVDSDNYVPHLHLQVRRGTTEYPWVLRGRLPAQSCVVLSDGPMEPTWPEKFINPEALDWE